MTVKCCRLLYISLEPFFNKKNNYADTIFYLTHLVRILSSQSVFKIFYFFVPSFRDPVRFTPRVCLLFRCSIAILLQLLAQNSTGRSVIQKADCQEHATIFAAKVNNIFIKKKTTKDRMEESDTVIVKFSTRMFLNLIL